MASRTGLVGASNCNRPTRNSGAVQGCVTRRCIGGTPGLVEYSEKRSAVHGPLHAARLGLAGVFGHIPAGKVPCLTLLQDKFPQNGCKNETARGAICLFSGVQGGGRAANHPYNKFTVWGLLRAMLLSDFRQAGVYSGEDPKAELVLTF